MARSCPTAGGEVKGLERGGGRIEGAWKEGRGRRREGLGEAKKGRGKRKGEWCAAIIATRWRLIATCSGLVCLFTPSFGLIRRRRGGGGQVGGASGCCGQFFPRFLRCFKGAKGNYVSFTIALRNLAKARILFLYLARLLA